MKKAFIIVLMVCLTFGMAFAAKSADIKVGAQAGFGTDSVKISDSNFTIKGSNAGFYFAGTGEYSVAEAIAVKAEFGINTMGKTKTVYTLGSLTTNTTASESSPVQVSIYAGVEYAIELSKEITLNLGTGVDMMIGKLGNSDDADTNGAIGLGFEAVGSYAIDKNVAVTFGAKFGWHFINTNDDIDEAYGHATSNDIAVNNTTFKVFAGATYAL